MPYKVRIEIRRSGMLVPSEPAQVVETGGHSATYALARAVSCALPMVGASMPGLWRAMIDLRRAALERGRPAKPSGEQPPSGEAP